MNLIQKLSGNITSDGFRLTNALVTYIPKSADIWDVKYGLNRYFDSILCNRTADYVSDFNILTTPFRKIESNIRVGKPCIVGLTGHPTYKEHWVVGTGIQSNADMVIVNDGWGNLGIMIQKCYIDYCAFIQ